MPAETPPATRIEETPEQGAPSVQPLATVIIPCFNEEPRLLREAVASADQPHSDLIVVNDGSTSPETLRALESLNARVVHTQNGGTAHALNVGIRASASDFVLPLGSDDWLDDGFVEALAKAMKADEALTIAYSDWSTFGREEQEHRAPDSVTVEDLAADRPILGAVMFRRRDWEALGGYDESLMVGLEDWEWAFRLLHAGGRARRIPGVRYHYRLKAVSRNTKNFTGVDAVVATRRAMLANVPDAAPLIAEGMLESIREAYQLGQAQSPIATAATQVARHWEARFGRADGALRRIPILDRAWDRWLTRR